jgi:cation diffusion facilitator family transporter
VKPRHTLDLSAYSAQRHDFELGNPLGERRAWLVVALTAAMMVAEIAVGLWSGSMALLADGWHMATHAVALGVTGFAYVLARRESADARYAFGTWKIEVLGGFASAIVLGLVALQVGYESVKRAFVPVELHYDEALWVAALGLAVNALCAWLLRHEPHAGHAHAAGGEHGHGHEHAHAHPHAHEPGREPALAHHAHAHDLNLRAAYMHVLADALTSVLAIAALLGARTFGWAWLDPAMGLVGALLVARWSLHLVRQTSQVLLDREMEHPFVAEIRARFESDGDSRICDLHVWRVSRTQFACVASVVSDAPRQGDEYRARLTDLPALVHVTVEVVPCKEHARALS